MVDILLTILLAFLVTSFVHATDESFSSSIDPVDDVQSADPDGPFRTKRQGHSDSNLKSILGSIFNKKLGLFGSLSSSSSSKNTETHYHTYEYSSPAPKPFDWLSLKKSIFSSLLQAVKAITGGVIALNGQLVKVKGHIMTAKGHLLATKGEKISDFGKNVAINAFGPPHHNTHQSDIHESEPSASSISGPSGNGASLEYEYSAPYKHGFKFPTSHYKDSSGYAKRDAPYNYILDNDDISIVV